MSIFTATDLSFISLDVEMSARPPSAGRVGLSREHRARTIYVTQQGILYACRLSIVQSGESE